MVARRARNKVCWTSISFQKMVEPLAVGDPQLLLNGVSEGVE